MSSKVISADPPSVMEQKHNEQLEAWCATRKEPMEESKRRQHVLQRLSNITKAWIRTIMITEYRMPSAEADQVESRIFSTGSYRYNVHSSGSDIDLVLIAPDKVTRRHFFTSLVDRLKNESWIKNIIPTEDAIVPIIAMECDGIDIDLSFGSVKRDKIPEKLDDDLIRGLDETAMRSCNAVRVAQLVIDLVPNTNTFRQALRFVKAWAKARGIYSSKFGFPTGIGWAILTAFACQCYPNQNPAGVVCRFFQNYNSWFKPDRTNSAIFLTEQPFPKNPIGRAWDPRTSKSDAKALFPILTPANPYGNSCFNVTKTTLRIMCEEFKRGHEILQAAMTRSPNPDLEFGVWGQLLESRKDHFLQAHKHYMHIKISTLSAETYQGYSEAVESRIRFIWHEDKRNMGKALECFPQVKIHVFSSRFEDPQMLETLKASLAGGKPAEGAAPQEFTAHYFFGLEMVAPPAGQRPPAQQQKLDLDAVVKAFKDQVQNSIKEYRPGVTKLPHVTVIDPSKFPEWLVQKKRKRDEEEHRAEENAPKAPQPADQSAQQKPAEATAAEVTPAPVAAPPAAAAQTTTADEALGMDF